MEVGLDYFINRYLSSGQGRFTSPDPLLSSAHPLDPLSWNRFTYAANNPLKYIDPLGLYVFDGQVLADKSGSVEMKRFGGLQFSLEQVF